ncbi:MAG TPA: gamma-glutamyl-gamma-aminobutyrate hydrolase family protein [Bacillota bacterium]|nr:gamma-glutamyl-gamma-aminobutyrate hydrolase family protein [Bacillota bacterium]
MRGNELVIILDFGSQYSNLIARRVREADVYCEIVQHDIKADKVRAMAPKGIILSGGPSSVYEDKAPQVDPAIFALGVPVLGICYGMQLMAKHLGGSVERAEKREYGKAELMKDEASCLRVFRIYLTEKGKSLKDTVMNAVEAVEQDAVKGLGAEDIAAIRRIMATMRGNLEKASED